MDIIEKLIAGCVILRIRDWDDLYETHRTRPLKRLDWVPLRNTMDGDGYTELLDHPNGASHLGAWVAILQIGSRCVTRGTLSRDVAGPAPEIARVAPEKPHTPQSLARMSRIPATVFDEAIPRLIDIGWLEVIENNQSNLSGAGSARATLSPETAGFARDVAGTAHESARVAPESVYGMVGNGRVGNGTAAARDGARQPDGFDLSEFFERLYIRHPKKGNRGIAERYLQEALRIVTPDQFEAAHAAWCESEEWNRDGGRYVRDLSKWILDKGWLDPLPKPSSDSGDVFDRAAALAREEEAA